MQFGRIISSTSLLKFNFNFYEPDVVNVVVVAAVGSESFRLLTEKSLTLLIGSDIFKLSYSSKHICAKIYENLQAIRYWHRFPCHFPSQSHVGPLLPDIQVPPFKQGFGSQVSKQKM